MGAGLPTTALYIMLVSVAQPALAQLGVPPIASHLFVLYYGVISEITPPVCASAYAAAGMEPIESLIRGGTDPPAGQQLAGRERQKLALARRERRAFTSTNTISPGREATMSISTPSARALRARIR